MTVTKLLAGFYQAVATAVQDRQLIQPESTGWPETVRMVARSCDFDPGGKRCLACSAYGVPGALAGKMQNGVIECWLAKRRCCRLHSVPSRTLSLAASNACMVRSSCADASARPAARPSSIPLAWPSSKPSAAAFFESLGTTSLKINLSTLRFLQPPRPDFRQPRHLRHRRPHPRLQYPDLRALSMGSRSITCFSTGGIRCRLVICIRQLFLFRRSAKLRPSPPSAAATPSAASAASCRGNRSWQTAQRMLRAARISFSRRRCAAMAIETSERGSKRFDGFHRNRVRCAQNWSSFDNMPQGAGFPHPRACLSGQSSAIAALPSRRCSCS